MSDPRTALVGAGYDAMIETWEAWSAQVADDPRHEWAADLASRLALTGVDLSQRQLGRARERVPNATFVHGDLTEISSYLPEVNSRLVAAAGFTVVCDEVVAISEPEGPVSFQWILAQR